LCIFNIQFLNENKSSCLLNNRMSSLKNHPMYDGKTSYCNKSFNLVNQKSPQNLELLLKNLDKSGTMLGTKIRSFGRKSKKLHKSRKKLYKSRKRYFGAYPFTEGKLSTSIQTEGLPLGAKSPSSIYQTFPNIFRQGSALPRPYDPVDNLRMQSLYEIHGFGRRTSKRKRCKSCGRKGKKHKSHKKSKRRRSQQKFGTTPGTPEWKQEASMRNKISNYMNQYANAGQLTQAKGWTPRSALYMNNTSSIKPNKIGMPNLPAQFTNNQLNSPILFNFGKPRKNKKNNRPSLLRKSLKKTRSFGPLVPNVAGPNTVGYQEPIPMYHAGANTIDFATNKLFRPNIVGSIGKVQSNKMNPRAWLTQSVGIGDGLGNKFRFGKKFGNMIYTPDGATYGSGHNTIMQPAPSYLNQKAFGGSVITLNKSGQIQITKGHTV
jgi:hypothetical protein